MLFDISLYICSVFWFFLLLKRLVPIKVNGLCSHDLLLLVIFQLIYEPLLVLKLTRGFHSPRILSSVSSFFFIVHHRKNLFFINFHIGRGLIRRLYGGLLFRMLIVLPILFMLVFVMLRWNLGRALISGVWIKMTTAGRRTRTGVKFFSFIKFMFLSENINAQFSLVEKLTISVIKGFSSWRMI